MGSRLLDNDINDGNALDTITARIQAMLPFVSVTQGSVITRRSSIRLNAAYFDSDVRTR